MSDNKKRGSVAIPYEKKLMIERLAVNLSVKVGRTITWTDLVHYTIDNYIKDAALDIEHSTKEILKKTQ